MFSEEWFERSLSFPGRSGGFVDRYFQTLYTVCSRTVKHIYKEHIIAFWDSETSNVLYKLDNNVFKFAFVYLNLQNTLV